MHRGDAGVRTKRLDESPPVRKFARPAERKVFRSVRLEFHRLEDSRDRPASRERGTRKPEGARDSRVGVGGRRCARTDEEVDVVADDRRTAMGRERNRHGAGSCREGKLARRRGSGGGVCIGRHRRESR
jgi:hypothetical protein